MVRILTEFQSIHFEQNYDAVIFKSKIAMRTSAHQIRFLYENDYEQYSLSLMSGDIWEAKLRGFDLIFNICEVRKNYQSITVIFV